MADTDLEAAGIVEMSDEEIDAFLATQGSGVLGLPTEAAPYLLPLSYGYDGEENLYFTYVVGADSRKETLSERAPTATFLVYTATTPFQWRSVLLEGAIESVDQAAYDEVSTTLSDAWRPEVFEEARLSNRAAIYRFAIESRTGLKHTGLPDGLRSEDERRSE